MKSILKRALCASIAMVRVTPDGMLLKDTWPSSSRSLLGLCFIEAGVEIKHFRWAVKRHLKNQGFTKLQAIELHERVVRQMLGRKPEVSTTNGHLSRL